MALFRKKRLACILRIITKYWDIFLHFGHFWHLLDSNSFFVRRIAIFLNKAHNPGIGKHAVVMFQTANFANCPYLGQILEGGGGVSLRHYSGKWPCNSVTNFGSKVTWKDCARLIFCILIPLSAWTIF